MSAVLDVDAPVVEPADLAEAVAAVRDGGALLFRGAGTKLGWGAPPERVDRVVATGRLSGLTSHDPGDLTVVVQAGMPLAALQEALAARGQRVAVDPPHEGATVGGTLAADDHGPRRLRYGTLRDLVIGTTVVLADGTVSRSGGRVIKNVAGYDLGRLWCGSLGTLGLVVEVVLRCHPLPETSGTLRVPADAATAGAVVLAVLAAPGEPVALDWDGLALLARFEGRPPAVTAQRDAFARLAAERGAGGGDWLEGRDEVACWAAVAEALRGGEGETTVRAGTLPAELPAAADALAAAAAEAGVEARLHSHAALGLHTARLSGADAPAHAVAVEGWRRRLAAAGGHAVVRRRITGLHDPDVIWGPEPAAGALMRRVKAQLDPDRRCAPGRFIGGI